MRHRGFGYLLLVLTVSWMFFLSTQISDAGSFNLKSSSQYLWGDGWLGSNEPFVAEQLRFKYEGEEKLKFSGYGRVAANTGNESVHARGTNGRLYFMYVDYAGLGIGTLRAGRHFVNYSAGSAVLDGATFDLHGLSRYAGISLSAGTSVLYGLGSDYSADNRAAVAGNLYLKNIGLNDLGISFARRYDAQQVARETFGLNMSSSFRYARPYAQGAYNNLTKSLDAASVGVDLYPHSSFSMKLEYYQTYPVFDSTSIYSVFAVNKYSEYLLRAQYDVSRSLSFNASAKRQDYQDAGLNADVLSLGSRISKTGEYSMAINLDSRAGYGGRIWGAEVTGDMALGGKFGISLGVQKDMYKRFDAETPDWQNALRYWGGARWDIGESSRLAARLENNSNQNFNNRFIGRVTLELAF